MIGTGAVKYRVGDGRPHLHSRQRGTRSQRPQAENRQSAERAQGPSGSPEYHYGSFGQDLRQPPERKRTTGGGGEQQRRGRSGPHAHQQQRRDQRYLKEERNVYQYPERRRNGNSGDVVAHKPFNQVGAQPLDDKTTRQACRNH